MGAAFGRHGGATDDGVSGPRLVRGMRCRRSVCSLGRLQLLQGTAAGAVPVVTYPGHQSPICLLLVLPVLHRRELPDKDPKDKLHSDKEEQMHGTPNPLVPATLQESTWPGLEA